MDQEVINAIEARAVATEKNIVASITPEIQKLRTEFSAQMVKIDAAYSKDAHQFRDWINANPLRAARVIGSACLVVGAVIMYVVRPWL